MNRVVYQSLTGNTKRLAEAVAKAIGVQPQKINASADFGGVETLFVGASIYGDKVSHKVAEMLQSLENVGRIALFGSSASGNTPYDEIAEICAMRGIHLCAEAFFCKGSFLLMNRKCPTAADLEAAQAFARNVCANSTL